MLRVGMIGAGEIGKMHAECYSNIPNARVVAIADPITERAGALADRFGAAVAEDGNAVIGMDGVDVVDLCVPTPLHPEYTVKAAKAGKHVLCEKPMALSHEEGRRMIEAAKEAGVKFMVAHVLRYFPENVSAFRTVKAGAIGTPAMVRTYRGGPNPALTKEWYGFREKSGGAIVDMLIHDIDFLKMCFGPVKEVYARGNLFEREEPWGPEYDLVMMEFKNGTIAHLSADWSGAEKVPFSARLEIAGTKGLIEYDSLKSVPIVLTVAEENDQKAGDSIPQSPLDPLSNPYTMEITEFLKAVERGTEVPIPPAEALESLDVALAAVESMRKNEPVEVER